MGEQDRVVQCGWQMESIEFVRKLNQCGEEAKSSELLHVYSSKIDAPLQIYIHPGAHEFPVAAVPMIVAFFKNIRRTILQRISFNEAEKASRTFIKETGPLLPFTSLGACQGL